MKKFLENGLIMSDIIPIEKNWIDYNGHLNAGYYNLIFDRSGDTAFAKLGLGPDYAAKTKQTIYTAEIHLCYLREVHFENPIRTATQIIDFDEKKIHVFQYLCHADEGWVAATNEIIFLHIDMAGPKVAPFPDYIYDNIKKIADSQKNAPLPDNLGKSISMRKK